MTISIWISLGALAVSVIALLHSIKNSISKSKISIMEMRNSFRVNVHESAMETLFLVEKIKKQTASEQEIRIVGKLIETAAGMASMYKTLKNNIETPWYISASTLIKEYDDCSSDLKEFNLILSRARTEFDNREIDKLERTVNGLHFRMLGSKTI